MVFGRTALARLLGATMLATLAASAHAQSGDVNLYTYREPGLIKPAIEAFTKATGIKVNTLFAADGPVTADRIAAGLDGLVPRSDLASVYRNLEMLEEAGLEASDWWPLASAYSSPGISTELIRPPSARRKTSLRLPSSDGVTRSTSGSRTSACSASVARKSFGRSDIASRSNTPFR